MMHVRQQIRNAITEKLKEIPAFKNRVYESRVYPLGKDDLPAALVFSETEIVENITKQGCKIQKRYIETAVYVFARANEKLENAIDPLAASVENKIYEDQTLGGIAYETNLSDTALFIGGEPDAPTGAARLSFISLALTQQGKSEVSIINNQGGIFA